jgi:hypothetical protein
MAHHGLFHDLVRAAMVLDYSHLVQRRTATWQLSVITLTGAPLIEGEKSENRGASTQTHSRASSVERMAEYPLSTAAERDLEGI